MKRSQGLPRKSHRSVVQLNNNASVDNRLTHASLLLGYLFESGVDFQRRTINLTGDIDESTFKLVDAAVSEMEANSKAAITIKINSPGGLTYQAMAIVGRLKESKCRIITKGYGAVMSAATLILACGDRRKISRHSFFMHHECSYDLGDSRHSEAKAFINQVDREQLLWSQWMEKFTGKSADFWAKTGVGVDAYYAAEQLLKLGVVDEVF